jgi:hypothetical protein
MRKTILIATILCAFLLAGCDTCSREHLDAYMVELEEVGNRFDEVERAAHDTPRSDVLPMIEQMQEIRREADDIHPPECARSAHEQWLAAMDSIIEGYLAFLAGEPDVVSDHYFDQSHVHFRRFVLLMAEIMAEEE